MKRFGYIIVVTMFSMACKKPYYPPAIANTSNYLVVEGVINPGTDSTFILLSRTVNLSSKTTNSPVTGATVGVQSDASNSYPLTEISPGSYAAPGLNLDNTRKYRLSIKTSDNKQYASDFVAVSITPPIDSVGYLIQNNGLQIYVNTHDPNNNTRYYRWDYSEAWQFHAKYESDYITNGTAIVARTPDQKIFACFSKDSSSSITLGSSAKLSQDVIYQNPVTTVASTSEKVETKFSILVHQYALTGDAFTFWTNLKKNTEQLGSIFDAQPSNINGNIHNVSDATEPVIGYVSVCTVQSKRIYILNSQLPSTWFPDYPYDCEEDSIKFNFDHRDFVAEDLIPLNSSLIPTRPFFAPNSTDPMPLGYLASGVDCVDCTIRGKKAAPPFWK
jgi:Domain of unknown function (DUF4249)